MFRVFSVILSVLVFFLAQSFTALKFLYKKAPVFRVFSVILSVAAFFLLQSFTALKFLYKKTLVFKAFSVILLVAAFFLLQSFAGYCDYSWQKDFIGRCCGGRAASVRPRGKLGGNGKYTDSYGRARVYGRSNDIYDKN